MKQLNWRQELDYWQEIIRKRVIQPMEPYRLPLLLANTYQNREPMNDTDYWQERCEKLGTA